MRAHTANKQRRQAEKTEKTETEEEETGRRRRQTGKTGKTGRTEREERREKGEEYVGNPQPRTRVRGERGGTWSARFHGHIPRRNFVPLIPLKTLKILFYNQSGSLIVKCFTVPFD